MPPPENPRTERPAWGAARQAGWSRSEGFRDRPPARRRLAVAGAPGSAGACIPSEGTRKGGALRPGEQVRQKPLGVAQKGALGLHAPQLLQEGQGDDLRVREPLEPLVAPPIGVEPRVGIVDEAEENGKGLFRLGEPLGMVGAGHPLLLREGRLRWPPFYSESAQHASSSGRSRSPSC